MPSPAFGDFAVAAKTDAVEARLPNIASRRNIILTAVCIKSCNAFWHSKPHDGEPKQDVKISSAELWKDRYMPKELGVFGHRTKEILALLSVPEPTKAGKAPVELSDPKPPTQLQPLGVS